MTNPNFLIIGVQKAATTSLYAYLAQHPQIYLSPEKEPHFLLEGGLKPWQYYPGQKIRLWHDRVTDPQHYERLFAGATAEHRAVGEASVWYLYRTAAAARIWQALPNVKLIVVLRNPIERCFSDYRQGLALGYETMTSFRAALCRDQKNFVSKNGQSFH